MKSWPISFGECGNHGGVPFEGLLQSHRGIQLRHSVEWIPAGLHSLQRDQDWHRIGRHRRHDSDRRPHGEEVRHSVVNGRGLGERAPVSEPHLARQLQIDPGQIGNALRQLRKRSLLHTADDGTIALTTLGRQNYERLVAARSAGLRDLLAGWHPDQHPEVQQFVDKLARDLVSDIPTPATAPA